MSAALLAVVAVFICLLFRVLNVHSQPERPNVICKDGAFAEFIYKASPRLTAPYVPPRLWGFSGHLQTVLHSIIGRAKCPWPLGERCHFTLDDGASVSYDLYQPIDAHPSGDDFTLAVCPGICNTSESIYVRTFVHHAQRSGYRCVVLNHIGALKSVKVTSPRIFTYGHTDEYAGMLSSVLERHPSTKVISVGFSMGGNIVVKYLGEKREKPAALLGGISICQGYDAIPAMELMLQWQNFRRCYLYIMTENMKATIMNHRNMLLSDDAKRTLQISEREIYSAATLPELDDAYTRRVFGFNSLTEFYQWQSCISYFDGITLPLIFINACDDPIVPQPLLPVVRNFAANHNQTMYIETAHGGHLGFYEGGLVFPNPVTWLDRTVVNLADGMIGMINSKCSSKVELADGDHSNCESDDMDEVNIAHQADISTSPLLAQAM